MKGGATTWSTDKVPQAVQAVDMVLHCAAKQKTDEPQMCEAKTNTEQFSCNAHGSKMASRLS